jgi:hypothetical protein
VLAHVRPDAWSKVVVDRAHDVDLDAVSLHDRRRDAHEASVLDSSGEGLSVQLM